MESIKKYYRDNLSDDHKVLLILFIYIVGFTLLFHLLVLINAIDKPKKYFYKIEVTYLDNSKNSLFTNDIPNIDTDIFNNSSVLEDGMEEIAIGVKSFRILKKIEVK